MFMLCSSDGGSETEAHGKGNPFKEMFPIPIKYQERRLDDEAVSSSFKQIE